MLRVLTVFIIRTGGNFTENFFKHTAGKFTENLCQFFEYGPMPTPTKLRNPTIVGSGDPDSAQWSHLSRFSLLRPLFGNNGNPPFKTTTQYDTCSPRRIFVSSQPRQKYQSDHCALSRPLEHTMVGFCDLVRVGNGPFSKKLAVKCTQSIKHICISST